MYLNVECNFCNKLQHSRQTNSHKCFVVGVSDDRYRTCYVGHNFWSALPFRWRWWWGGGRSTAALWCLLRSHQRKHGSDAEVTEDCKLYARCTLNERLRKVQHCSTCLPLTFDNCRQGGGRAELLNELRLVSEVFRAQRRGDDDVMSDCKLWMRIMKVKNRDHSVLLFLHCPWFCSCVLHWRECRWYFVLTFLSCPLPLLLNIIL